MRSENLDPENFDGGLPDDLASLGNRLAEDASRLAARYPAGEPGLWLREVDVVLAGEPAASPQAVGTRSGEGRHPWWQTVVALAVAIALLVTAWQWIGGHFGNAPHGHNPILNTQPADNDPDAGGAEDSDRPSVVPAGVFESLSSPEQEGLLDLMESEGIPQPTISL